MKKLYNPIIFVAFLGIIISCDDIIEEDITNDIIQIISPGQDSTIEGNTVQFSWQALPGADEYRIQVLSDAQAFVLDSTVSTNVFVSTLNPGGYQWRVKGENFAYETQFTFPIDFTVEASDNLSNQTIILLTPSGNYYTNDTDILLTWTDLESVEYYEIEIIKNLGGQTTVLQQSNITTSSFSIPIDTLDEDAEYIWKIKGVNSHSETAYSQRSIFLDTTPPNQPMLVSPDDMDITTSAVSFNWTNGADPGNVQSTITNTIEISTDINFASFVHTATTTNNSYQYVFGNDGAYYWRVKASDAANNISDYSNVRSLNIQ